MSQHLNPASPTGAAASGVDIVLANNDRVTLRVGDVYRKRGQDAE